MSAASERTTVIYILGVSRSGSTVVGYALGAHADAAFVGEMANTPARGWAGDRRCSCGDRWDVCPFWQEVQGRLDERLGGYDSREYVRLRSLFEPYQVDLRGWLRLAKAMKTRSASYDEYAAMMNAVFGSLREASGKRVIVDSSKDPSRAVALAGIPQLDLVLVHVVRDARGVAYSMSKRFEQDVERGVHRPHAAEPVLRASALWSLTNGLCEVATRTSRARSVRIRYEDFVSNPGRELARVGRAVHLDYADVASALADGDALPTAHVLNGNRMRMSGGIRLRPDHQWKTELGVDQRLKVQLGAALLLRWYGY